MVVFWAITAILFVLMLWLFYLLKLQKDIIDIMAKRITELEDAMVMMSKVDNKICDIVSKSLHDTAIINNKYINLEKAVKVLLGNKH